MPMAFQRVVARRHYKMDSAILLEKLNDTLSKHTRSKRILNL